MYCDSVGLPQIVTLSKFVEELFFNPNVNVRSNCCGDALARAVARSPLRSRLNRRPPLLLLLWLELLRWAPLLGPASRGNNSNVRGCATAVCDDRT